MSENQDIVITNSYVEDKVDHLMSSIYKVRKIYETMQKENWNTLTNESKSKMLDIMTNHDKMLNEALTLNRIFIDKFNTEEFLKLHGLSNIITRLPTCLSLILLEQVGKIATLNDQVSSGPIEQQFQTLKKVNKHRRRRRR